MPIAAPEPDAPEAPTSFDVLPLSKEVRRALDDMGYEKPTPVQVAVFETTSLGKDVVVQARTGTGKTSAFGLPIVDRLVNPKKAKPQALILCPTRELAIQVSRELGKLGQHRGLSMTAIYGGAPIQKQIDAIDNGAQIISGTPGRVLDHLKRRTLDPSTIKCLVLDEADEMLSMGFERELNAILDFLPERHQTMLFSATVPPNIERMAKNRCNDPEFIILSGDQVGALQLQHFAYMTSSDKPAALKHVLDVEAPVSAIIFCNTKAATERVADYLQRHDISAAWINGDMQQNERERVMQATRDEKIQFLVATDVAARGIDISHLTHVINYDFPQDAEAYVHRTGRTGRAGKTGTAISLVTPQDVGNLYLLSLTYKIRPQERRMPTAQDAKTREETDVVAGLAQAFAAMADDRHRQLARRLLSHDDGEDILAGLLSAHLRAEPAPKPQRRRNRQADRAEAPRERKPAPRRERSDDDAAPRAQRPARTAARTEPRAERAEKRNDGAEKRNERAEPRADRSERPGRSERPERSERPRRGRGGPRLETDAPRVYTQDPINTGKPAVKDTATSRNSASRDSASRDGASRDGASRDSASRDGASRDGASRDGADRDGASANGAGAKDPRDSVESAAMPSTDPHIPSAKASEARRDRGAPPPIGEGFVEIHVNVGRRDGAKVRWFRDTLSDAGLTTEAVGRIKLRDRYAFVEILADDVTQAMSVLNDTSMEDRQVVASLSERSREA